MVLSCFFSSRFSCFVVDEPSSYIGTTPTRTRLAPETPLGPCCAPTLGRGGVGDGRRPRRRDRRRGPRPGQGREQLGGDIAVGRDDPDRVALGIHEGGPAEVVLVRRSADGDDAVAIHPDRLGRGALEQVRDHGLHELAGIPAGHAEAWMAGSLNASSMTFSASTAVAESMVTSATVLPWPFSAVRSALPDSTLAAELRGRVREIAHRGCASHRWSRGTGPRASHHGPEVRRAARPWPRPVRRASSRVAFASPSPCRR